MWAIDNLLAKDYTGRPWMGPKAVSLPQQTTSGGTHAGNLTVWLPALKQCGVKSHQAHVSMREHALSVLQERKADVALGRGLRKRAMHREAAERTQPPHQSEHPAALHHWALAVHVSSHSPLSGTSPAPSLNMSD